MQTENSSSIFDSPAALAEQIVKILIEKKGIDVRMFNVTGKTSVTDYYINVTGRSSTHVGALADNLVDKLCELGINAARVEGKRGNSWVLVDYQDCIVNIFDKEMRSFYSFDRHLPAECECDITSLIEEVDRKFEI